MASADENRQRTTLDRRRLIIQTVEKHLGDATEPALDELGDRLQHDQWIITGADIDSLVSSALLCMASEGRWRVGAVIVRSKDVRTSPALGSLEAAVQRSDVYGVDLFSPLFPSISNHPLLFGPSTRRPRNSDVRDRCAAYDESVLAAMVDKHTINLSGWAGIKATAGSDDYQSRYYKYPLGTAQLALACLEVLDLAPRLYDRQYLPWMIANCDGGLKTIRQYPWNVEAWWSALAAVAGPASLSESIYQVAIQQRPTEFVDVDRRLRYDYPTEAAALRSDWNVAGSTVESMTLAVKLINELSGWIDPFGDVDQVVAWPQEKATGNILTLKRTPATKTRPATPGLNAIDLDALDLHLLCARTAVHVNFSEFRERGVGLGWLLPTEIPAVEAKLGPPPVDFDDDDEDDVATGLDDDDGDLSVPTEQSTLV